MKKINLFINWYNEKNPQRKKELDECLLLNAENPAIDLIVVIVSPNDVEAFRVLVNPDNTSADINKLRVINSDKRPTYNDFFKLTEQYPNDINIISNTDMILDDGSLSYLKKLAWIPTLCFALSRWELKKNTTGRIMLSEAIHSNRADSQDVWIFFGAVPSVSGADFTIGTMGCDNKISYLLWRVGFKVYNPSNEIKTYHLHISQIRNYLNRWNQPLNKLSPPYKPVPVVSISEIPEMPKLTPVQASLPEPATEIAIAPAEQLPAFHQQETVGEIIPHSVSELIQSKKIKGNVISFSLFGKQDKYNVGMLRNIELAKKIYDGWQVVVFHDNTLPENIIQQIGIQAELINVSMVNDLPSMAGMLWRFFINDFSLVERFICRDADSRLLIREKEAVDAWIKSGKRLHIMRDHPHHGSQGINMKILGGMWGMVVDKNTSFINEIISYVKNKPTSVEIRNVDMFFLEKIIYEKYKNDMMVHQSIDYLKEDFVFPFPSPMQDQRFVGEIINADESREPQHNIWKTLKEKR